MGCFGLTEPGNGSDAGAASTTARLVERILESISILWPRKRKEYFSTLAQAICNLSISVIAFTSLLG